MINKIIDGICMKLNETFGDGYEIHTEHVKQGFQEPCFFVSCISPISTQKLGNRQFRNNLFCIQYFPPSNEPKGECYSVLEDLYLAMEYITVDRDLTMGTKMHGEVVDGVLSFFVNYDVFVMVIKGEAPSMEKITKEIKMKGE